MASKNSKINKIIEVATDVARKSAASLPALALLVDPSIITHPGELAVKLAAGIAATQLQRLANDYNGKKAGIKDKPNTEKPYLICIQLLHSIEGGQLEEERFVAMKSLFLSSVQKGTDAATEELAYHILQVMNKLSGTEITILRSIFQIRNNETISTIPPDQKGKVTARDEWLDLVAEQSGHQLKDLVELHEDHLVELHLITKPKYNDRSGVSPSSDFRLTKLGITLCEFMTKFPY